MKRIIVRHVPAGRELVLVDSPDARPSDREALIAVHSISLNRGEVAAALQRAADGWEPGWDFAGTVVRAARDGGGPAEGARVAGVLDSGAWGECAAVPVDRLAQIPDAISFEAAATLPLAGLTALYALEKGGVLAGKHVLITGASGGMGRFAVQLALLAGAHVTALVHRNTIDDAHSRLRTVTSDERGLDLLQREKFDLIVEGVGGNVFAAAAASLAPGGTLVTLGATADTQARFDIRHFFNIGNAQIYGFNIFEELSAKPAARGLTRLFSLVESGLLSAPVTYRGATEEIDAVSRRLLASEIPGKAVLSWAA